MRNYRASFGQLLPLERLANSAYFGKISQN
jgi:hypothetical protein